VIDFTRSALATHSTALTAVDLWANRWRPQGSRRQADMEKLHPSDHADGHVVGFAPHDWTYARTVSST